MNTSQARSAGRFIVDAPSVWTDTVCDVCLFAGFLQAIFERSDGVVRCDRCEVNRLRRYERLAALRWSIKYKFSTRKGA